jgi:hypothetical protein
MKAIAFLAAISATLALIGCAKTAEPPAALAPEPHGQSQSKGANAHGAASDVAVNALIQNNVHGDNVYQGSTIPAPGAEKGALVQNNVNGDNVYTAPLGTNMPKAATASKSKATASDAP